MSRIFFFGLFLMILGIANTYYQFSQLPPGYYKIRIANINSYINSHSERDKKQKLIERIEYYLNDIRLLIKKNKFEQALIQVVMGQAYAKTHGGLITLYQEELDMIQLEIYMKMVLKEYYDNKKKGSSNKLTTAENNYLLEAEVLLKKINNQGKNESLEGK